MIILGLNAYHGDSSACLTIDGSLIAAAEEERFRRIKHWAGFPIEAVRYCLDEARVKVEEIDHIALNRNPKANLLHKALFTFRKYPSFGFVKDRLKNASRLIDIKQKLAQEFSVRAASLRAQVHHIEHHVAHLASAFMVSPFEKAAVVSVDGFGDFVGAMWGVGKDNKIEVGGRIFFPHSLGLYYLAMTQFLGFCNYGDEYKVMGLAGFGEPSRLGNMRRMVKLNSNGGFELGLKYFSHLPEGITMAWEDGEPRMGPVYSREMERILGPARIAKEPIEKRHEDIAASLQAMYEEAFFHLLNHVYEQTGMTNLCLAGGCAMNSVANGKIFDRTPFEEVYIQPAAGDAGGALGAAYHVWNQKMNQPRDFVMEHAYWGPEFNEAEVKAQIEARRRKLDEENCDIKFVSNDRELCEKTAKEIADGKVVGWFQGRMEWGPRALGNRSIVVDPRRAEMKDVLNGRIKRREPFRPFAPSILLERAGEYFEKDYPDPFMIKVYPIRPEKRAEIPAVTHVDGTGRLQTVRKEDNPLYWKLINEFERITGVPALLNTSFNENEPIVCKPEEAIQCFLRTKIDVLLIGNWWISREKA
ncbi:MAG: carbamoyltransferase [Candidatus Aenigmarchaeota archaeon]|nr:carbamoyltransferase [Candidatus Aenigmarchaeota archaeon]